MNAATRFFWASLVVGLATLPSVAWPCGAGFGDSVALQPNQRVFISYMEGVETYVFNPAFCGASRDFGLILPVPSGLVADPALMPAELLSELAAYTAPTEVKECMSSGTGCGASAGDSTKGGINLQSQEFDAGVNVVDSGQVGLLDWTLLRADSTAAFTDWLDANSYPYQAEHQALFTHYVINGWYFVAFKVHVEAAQADPQAQLCGHLGPVAVTFASSAPVVPSRIAAANAVAAEGDIWRITLVAASQQQLVTSTDYNATLYFAATVTEAVRTAYPTLGALAAAGTRLTTLDLQFPWDRLVQSDMQFAPDPNPVDYRATVVVYEECGCQAASASLVQLCVWLTGVAVLLGWRRRYTSR